MKSLTQFIQEACKGGNCKINKTLQDIINNDKDILNNTKRLKKIDDILEESLEDEISENIDIRDPNKYRRSINMFKVKINEVYFYYKTKNPDITVGFNKDGLIEFIDEFNSLKQVPYKLKYEDELVQKIARRLANAYNYEHFYDEIKDDMEYMFK